MNQNSHAVHPPTRLSHRPVCFLLILKNTICDNNNNSNATAAGAAATRARAMIKARNAETSVSGWTRVLFVKRKRKIFHVSRKTRSLQSVLLSLPALSVTQDAVRNVQAGFDFVSGDTRGSEEKRLDDLDDRVAFPPFVSLDCGLADYYRFICPMAFYAERDGPSSLSNSRPGR